VDYLVKNGVASSAIVHVPLLVFLAEFEVTGFGVMPCNDSVVFKLLHVVFVLKIWPATFLIHMEDKEFAAHAKKLLTSLEKSIELRKQLKEHNDVVHEEKPLVLQAMIDRDVKSVDIGGKYKIRLVTSKKRKRPSKDEIHEIMDSTFGPGESKRFEELIKKRIQVTEEQNIVPFLVETKKVEQKMGSAGKTAQVATSE
jgi:hypothetical protein